MSDEPQPKPTRMRLAIPERCTHGHTYYRESGATLKCPYCAQRALAAVESELKRIKTVLRELSA